MFEWLNFIFNWTCVLGFGVMCFSFWCCNVVMCFNFWWCILHVGGVLYFDLFSFSDAWIWDDMWIPFHFLVIFYDYTSKYMAKQSKYILLYQDFTCDVVKASNKLHGFHWFFFFFCPCCFWSDVVQILVPDTTFIFIFHGLCGYGWDTCNAWIWDQCTSWHTFIYWDMTHFEFIIISNV